VSRLIVLCERPKHLSAEEALTWFRRATDGLVGRDGIEAVSLTALESVSLRWARSWDWLIEVELPDSGTARRLVGETPWGELLADLRLLGMRPCVAVADRARATPLGRAG
jgi:hypothetical protein